MVSKEEIQLALRLKYQPFPENFGNILIGMPTEAILSCALRVGYPAPRNETEMQQFADSVNLWTKMENNRAVRQLYTEGIFNGLTEFYARNPDVQI